LYKSVLSSLSALSVLSPLAHAQLSFIEIEH
jgi:hypothetical protein